MMASGMASYLKATLALCALLIAPVVAAQIQILSSTSTDAMVPKYAPYGSDFIRRLFEMQPSTHGCKDIEYCASWGKKYCTSGYYLHNQPVGRYWCPKMCGKCDKSIQPLDVALPPNPHASTPVPKRRHRRRSRPGRPIRAGTYPSPVQPPPCPPPPSVPAPTPKPEPVITALHPIEAPSPLSIMDNNELGATPPLPFVEVPAPAQDIPVEAPLPTAGSDDFVPPPIFSPPAPPAKQYVALEAPPPTAGSDDFFPPPIFSPPAPPNAQDVDLEAPPPTAGSDDFVPPPVFSPPAPPAAQDVAVKAPPPTAGSDDFVPPPIFSPAAPTAPVSDLGALPPLPCHEVPAPVPGVDAEAPPPTTGSDDFVPPPIYSPPAPPAPLTPTPVPASSPPPEVTYPPPSSPPPQSPPPDSPPPSSPPPISPPPSSPPPEVTNPPPQESSPPPPARYIPRPPAQPYGLAEHRELLRLVNEGRAQNGKPPLCLNAELSIAAYTHSKDMCEKSYFEHNSPSGGTPWKRIADAGYPGGSAEAENIAAGYSTPQDVYIGWKGSPGHWENILGNYKHMGVGIYRGGKYGIYWTQNFGASESARCL